MVFALPHFIYSVKFSLTEFSNSKPLSVESGMRKQQRAVTFCCKCYIGQVAGFNILTQYLYITGQYIPLCDEDGYYKPNQCHGSVGQCWCVDRYGNEVTGSRTNGAAECGKLRTFCGVWFRGVIPFGYQPGYISSIRTDVRPNYTDFETKNNKL